MRTQGRDMVPFGELVAFAFDKAALCGGNPDEVSRLATSVVMDVLRRARLSPPPAPPARSRAQGGST